MKRSTLLTLAVSGVLAGQACTNNGGGSTSSTSSGGVNRPDGGASSSGSSSSSSSSSGSPSSSSSSSSGSPSSSSSSSSSSSGMLTVSTISALKALIAADPMCSQSTNMCQYNTTFHDFRLEGVYVMSAVHSDFDNKARVDAGATSINVPQEALYLATSPTAAANEGIELVAPTYFTLPALSAGDVVNVEGTLRVNFGNPYFRVSRIFNETDGGLATVTPVTVDPSMVANTNKGVESMDGGCSLTVVEDSLTGEPYEGSLVDVTLGAGNDIIFHPVVDGGVAHRFSLGNNIMVSDNFGVLSSMQTDGGISIDPGKHVTKLRGFSYYSFGCRKIQPRSWDDITIAP